MDNSISSDLPFLLKIHGDNIGEVNFSSNVAGTTFVKNSEKLLRFLKERVPMSNIILKFFREPDNEYDSNAVRVEVSIQGSSKSGKIGYVPKDRAPLVSYVLAHPEKYSMNVHNVVLVGGDREKPNIGVFFEYNILLNTKGE